MTPAEKYRWHLVLTDGETLVTTEEFSTKDMNYLIKHSFVIKARTRAVKLDDRVVWWVKGGHVVRYRRS